MFLMSDQEQTKTDQRNLQGINTMGLFLPWADSHLQKLIKPPKI